MNEEYGVKGRVRTLHQRKNWLSDSGIAHLPNHDSFDVEFSPTGGVLLETTYTFSNDVYGHACFVYDDDQRLIRANRFDESDREKSSFEYEYVEGRCLWTARDPTGIVTGRGVEEYDAGCLMSSNTYDAAGHPTHLITYEYTAGKRAKKVSKYLNQGKPYEIQISHFDSLGRVAETFGLTGDERPLGDGRYKFEYDEEGRPSRTQSYNDWGKTDLPNHVSRFTYLCDGHGNWIQRNEYSRWQSDTGWKKHKTTRELTYYLAVDR